MSHQLKTPVASLKLSNSLLLENDLSSEEREEFLQKCNEDIDKLEWLVSSLIKMSRLEAGIIEIDMKKSSIKNTIIKAVNGVYIKALNKNIDIDMENLQDDTIEHDLKWTKEALTNILENAVKYTKNGGRIKITTYKLPSLLKMDIEDNGIGIPEKEINNIFKKFYRGNSKEVTEAEGIGVGLYLSRKIIEKQGGSIMVHSRDGEGSRFTVFLQKCYEN
jgi:signal transduction histidine kinase